MLILNGVTTFIYSTSNIGTSILNIEQYTTTYLNSKTDIISSKLDSIANNSVVIPNSKLDSIASKVDYYAKCNPIPVTAPTTISNAGTYCLTNDVNVSSGNGITISANNVKLDLNKKTISGTGGDNGIVVNAGTSNVIIFNGIITGMSQNGVLLQGGCSCIQDCDLTSNTTGITIWNGSKNIIKNCSATYNGQAGFSLISSSNNLLSMCKAINSMTASTSAYGFYSSAGTGNIFDDCLAEDISTSANGAGCCSAGFMLDSNEANSQIVNSKAYNCLTPGNSTNPAYGIRIQETFSGTASSAAAGSHGATINGAHWSPDGKYLAVDGATSSGEVRVFSFWGTAIRSIATFTHSATLQTIKWSPNGNFLVIGGAAPVLQSIVMRVLNFDGTALTEITNTSTPTGTVQTTDWSPNGQFIAVGGTDSTLRIFTFNGVLTQVATASHGAAINSVSWSHDGQYVLIAGAAGTGGNDTRIYSFDGVSTLSLVASATHGATLNGADFHPTGQYAAVGGSASGGNQIRVFSFNGTSLSTIATAAPGATVQDISWNTLGTHLGVGGLAGNSAEKVCWNALWTHLGVGAAAPNGAEIHIYSFSNNTLSQTNSQIHGGTINTIDWSQSDNYLAVAGASAGGIDTRIYCANITGANKCLIYNNMVSCVSGGYSTSIGINASSARNAIVNNIATDNDINYRLVSNIFSGGLLGRPTRMDNISLPPR